MPESIAHDAAAHRFTTVVDGVTGHVEYSLGDGVLSIDHTLVPSEIGGRGIAGALVKAVVEHARANGLKVHPACSYAEVWMKRHPEYASLRA